MARITIEKKFSLIEEKEEFYTMVASYCNLQIKYVKTMFNQTTGFKVTEKHETEVHRILDHRIEYEKAVNNFKKKYPKL
jgi:hypothetical protein